MLQSGDKVGITVCSNAQTEAYRENVEALKDVLKGMGLTPVCSPYLYASEAYFSGSGKERGEALNEMFQDNAIKKIFDISGGDIANEVLEYLDYDAVRESPACFYGYSDLTTVLNAIYARTGKESGLYQIRNLIYENGRQQQKDFSETFFEGTSSLYDINVCFLQGECMEGEVIGGNIRCFLKLAGTEYMPDFTGKILLLEGLNTTSPQAATYLIQLRQMGAFEKLSGILLGTFTRLDLEIFVPSIEELVQKYAGREIPIARTMEIGHGKDTKCIYIGRNRKFERRESQ